MSTSFKELLLNDGLITGLEKQGITVPTAIQVLTIPAFLEGKDLIVESHTGSGKTLAFLLPLFQKINVSKKETQALILAPTHELVMQIHAQIGLLATNSGFPMTSTPIIGEVHMEKQIKKLKEKPHIVVGSCGRVLDLMRKKKLAPHTLKTIIIDEADNLLDNKQAGPIQEIIGLTMRDRQLCTFSASISKKTLAMANGLMQDPVVLKTAPKTSLNPQIEHLYLVGDRREKFDLLRKLLAATQTKKALIFVSQNTDSEGLVEKLNYHQHPTASISGKSTKEDRKTALTRFRTGKVKCLVSSDLSARGLDVPEITHVFHFDFPLTANEYLHRAGRTARGLLSGTSICLATPKELGAIRIYEKEFGIQIKPVQLKEGKIIPGTPPIKSTIPKALSTNKGASTKGTAPQGHALKANRAKSEDKKRYSPKPNTPKSGNSKFKATKSH